MTIFYWWPWCRIKRLRAALDAATDVGVYSASVQGGDKPYEKRTDYMNGWNDCAMKSLQEAVTKLKKGDWE